MNSNDTVWYANVPRGEKYLCEMLILDDGNIDAWHKICVSGHKQTDSLQNYSRSLSAARKQTISSVLVSSLIEVDDGDLNHPSTDNGHLSPLLAIDLIEVPNEVDRFLESFPKETLHPMNRSRMNF